MTQFSSSWRPTLYWRSFDTNIIEAAVSIAAAGVGVVARLAAAAVGIWAPRRRSPCWSGDGRRPKISLLSDELDNTLPVPKSARRAWSCSATTTYQEISNHLWTTPPPCPTHSSARGWLRSEKNNRHLGTNYYHRRSIFPGRGWIYKGFLF